MKYLMIKRIFGIFFIIMFVSIVITNQFYLVSQGQDEDWSEPTEITKYDYTYVPSPTSIAVDLTGDWHIVYTDRIRYENGSQRHFIKYKNPMSTEILAEKYGNIFEDIGEGAGHPCITIDPDEGLHVTYITWSNELPLLEQYQSVMYTKKEASLSSWSTPQEIATFKYTWIPSRSSIVVDSNGDWHIVYPDRVLNEDYSQRQFIKYKNPLSTETLAESYYVHYESTGTIIGEPSIAISSNGRLHVTYVVCNLDDGDDISSQSIMYMTKDKHSSSWSKAKKIAEFEYVFVPSPTTIAIDSDGNWHIVYPDRILHTDYSEERYIKYKNPGTTETLAEEYGNIFDETGEGVGHPSIAIDSSGDLHVIYTHMNYLDTFNQSIMYTTREAPDISSSGKGAAQNGGSILDYWWIYLIIIVVIVALIEGISLRKKPSTISDPGTTDFPERTVGQTTSERKHLPPPPPRPKSPLPPPPPPKIQ